MIFITNLKGWDGVPIHSLLQQGISIPTFIANDANAGALAQLWNHEKNLTKKDLIYIVAGQGIGCGMISDGAILQGAIGIAGEIGHTTIDYHGPRCACGNYWVFRTIRLCVGAQRAYPDTTFFRRGIQCLKKS